MQIWKYTETHVEKYKCENVKTVKEYVNKVNIYI